MLLYLQYYFVSMYCLSDLDTNLALTYKVHVHYNHTFEILHVRSYILKLSNNILITLTSKLPILSLNPRTEIQFKQIKLIFNNHEK